MPYSAREVLAKLRRAGFEEVRQSGDVPEGTFRKILKQAGMSLDQFREL